MENKDLVVELTDADGEVVKVQIVSHFTDNGKDYVIANDLGNDEDAYILEVRTNGEESELVSIDDEAEFDRLCQVVEDLEESEEEE